MGGDEVFGSGQSPIEEDSADNGFSGIGQKRNVGAAAGFFFTAAHI